VEFIAGEALRIAARRNRTFPPSMKIIPIHATGGEVSGSRSRGQTRASRAFAGRHLEQGSKKIEVLNRPLDVPKVRA
jgi:hypothetical protein